MPVDLVAGNRKAFPASAHLFLAVEFPAAELAWRCLRQQALICCSAVVSMTDFLLLLQRADLKSEHPLTVGRRHLLTECLLETADVRDESANNLSPVLIQ